MSWFRRHLTFANVMSCAALFIALGGTSYAALKLPKNSVGSKQIKKNAVTSTKVKNRSLSAADFRAGSLPAGRQGPPGAPGRNGADGARGANGANGTAVAYARVDPNGALVGDPPQAKGITAANITHSNTAPDSTAGSPTTSTGVGVYCFGGLGFTPKSAHVALDNTDAMPPLPGLTGGSLNFIASVAIFKGEELGRCKEGFEQARVAIQQVSNTAAPTLANHGFVIWFE